MRRTTKCFLGLTALAVLQQQMFAGTPIPPDSKMAAADPALQRVLVNSLQAGATLHLGGGTKVIGISSRPSPTEVGTKLGWSSLEFAGESWAPGAKGAFRISDWTPIPGDTRMVGMWVHLTPDANITKLGFELSDRENENFSVMIDADWTGWKWVELETNSSDLKPLADQKGKNGQLDFPLLGVRFAWFTKEKAVARLNVNGLCAVTDISKVPPALPLEVELAGPGFTDANTPFRSLIDLTNFSDRPVDASIEYTVEHDATLDDSVAPHPIYGSDEALGKRSWTEGKGEILEEGALTDGKAWTAAQTTFITNAWEEAFQYVDLGRPIDITRMTWDSGDANRLLRVDVSSSLDGKEYTPIEGLQSFDQFKKWGTNEFPLPGTVKARFLRFRYHKEGNVRVQGFHTPPGISVYDGIADEPNGLPSIGRVAESGKLSATIPARNFTPLAIETPTTLKPGAYRVVVKVTADDRTYYAKRHLFVKPEPIAKLNDRLGLNVANPKFVDDIRTIGLGWGRFENIKWPMVSKVPGVFDYIGQHDPYVDVDGILGAYHRNGIGVLPFVFLFQTYDKPKPAANEPYPLTREEVGGFAEYTFQTIARYGSKSHPADVLKTPDKKSGLGYLKHVEIWNEQNHNDFGKWGGPVPYYHFFREAAEAAKKADPDILVSNGGFSGISLRLADALRTIKYDDGKTPLDFVDVLSVHMYTGRQAPEVAMVNANTSHLLAKDVRTFEENLQLLSDWRDRYKPNMPIWMTETGYDTDYIHFVDERTQAAWMARDVMLCLANGIEKVLVYRELGSDNGMWAASGVMRSDGTPKPSYFSYATLTRELNGAEGDGLRLPTEDSSMRIYAWKVGSETVLSAWMVKGTGQLPLNLGTATVTDCFGDRQEKLDASALKLTEFPIYIRNISNLDPVLPLIERAKQAVERRKELRKQEVAARVYSFGFGGTVEEVGGIVHGDYRASTPVLSNEIYDASKGYGFLPSPALGDISLRRNDPQNQKAVRINKGIQFQFKAEPGKYTLQAGIAPSRQSQLTVNGVAGGSKTIAVEAGPSDIAIEVEVGAEPLRIELDGAGALRWLTLIETPQVN